MRFRGVYNDVTGVLMVCLAIVLASLVSYLVWYHGMRLFCQGIVVLDGLL